VSEDCDAEEPLERADPRYRLCDWGGGCRRAAYVEVYPPARLNWGWSYLCRLHFHWDRLRNLLKLRRYPNGWCFAADESQAPVYGNPNFLEDGPKYA